MTVEVKPTLRVISEADFPGKRGVTDGQTYQRLIGWPGVQDTDRVRVGRAVDAGLALAVIAHAPRLQDPATASLRQC